MNRKESSYRDLLYDSLKTAAILALATALGLLFRELAFTEPNIVVVYILAVLLTARVTHGYLFGILASAVSLLGFNYYFTAPFHTLAVYDSSYFTTFGIMAVTAVITSTLTSKAKHLTREAEEREAESRLLYRLTGRLQKAEDADGIVTIAAEILSELFRESFGCICFDRGGSYIAVQQRAPALPESEIGKTAAAGRAGGKENTSGEKQCSPAVHRTVKDAGMWERELRRLKGEPLLLEDKALWPVRGHGGLLGAVWCAGEASPQVRGKDRLFSSILDNVAIALDRVTAVRDRAADQEMMTRERDRANLLRAISHDLRTPLSGIMGTSEILMDLTEGDDRRFEMMQGIYQDADWLYSLVNNILSLTRLQDGKIVIHKEMEALEEIIESALSRIAKTRPGRDIQVELPEEFHLVPMDAKLIEQVISNLLDNALKHTPDSRSIQLSVSYEGDMAKVTVKDEGEGIAECDRDHIFTMFYTSSTRASDARNGIGLGLAICETVVKAHGGRIWAGDRTDGPGAEFVFELPLEDKGQNV